MPSKNRNHHSRPSDDTMKWLCEASQRGVDVRLCLAGEHTDQKTVRLISRNHFKVLLKNDIRVFEYQPTMIHAKTWVVDGHMSYLGSANFNQRPLKSDDELAVIAIDSNLNRTLAADFEDDCKSSLEVTKEKARTYSSFLNRLIEKCLIPIKSQF